IIIYKYRGTTLCKEGKVEDAEEVMRHMNGKGVEPNVVTYNVIIDGYCLRGQMDRARSLFDSMTDKSIKPDIFSYSTLINGYCKKKKLDEAMHLFHEISRNGLKPSIVTYNTIFENGLVEKAMSLFHELEKKREDIDIELYTVIIDGLCKNGQLDKAHAIFEKLSLIGLFPNVITYTTIINGLCLEGLLDEAKDMLRKMEHNGCSPNNCTYNVIVQGFLKCGKISEMNTFLKEMSGRDFSFDASSVLSFPKFLNINNNFLSDEKLLSVFHEGVQCGAGMGPGVDNSNTSNYKSFLQQLAQHEELCLSEYKTIRIGESHILLSVEIEGEVFHGDAAKSKKQAEEMLARQLFPSDLEDEISKTKPFMETKETKSPKQSTSAEKVTESIEKSPSSVVPLWNLISC
uniref:Pentatricopeptide repeat-containing protein At1g12700, mitochondrial n=1 Tax=Nicotiana tabacum TaxID=4097 RepID=A0A1S4CP91_TOBAC